LEAAVTSYEREAKMEGSCSDDGVGHVGNSVAGNEPQGASDVVIKRKDFERGSVLAEFADNLLFNRHGILTGDLSLL
jgi:hypothetical protein